MFPKVHVPTNRNEKNYQINCEGIHAMHQITGEEVSAILRVHDEETNARVAKQNQKADYRIQNETNFAVLQHQPKTPMSGALTHDKKQNMRGENNFNALPHQMETPAVPNFAKKFKRQVSLESMNLDGSDGIEVDIELAKRIDDLIASSSSSNSLGRKFDKTKESSGSKSPSSSDYQRLLARNTMANTTPGLHPVKPRKRTKKRRKQTEDPKTPQFSPFAKFRMEHGFGESAEEHAECARSVAPSVVSEGISEPQTTDPQTPQFSPYVREHPSLNDSAKEPVEYARSVAPSVISVAISRPQVPPSPWYPPIPDPTKNRQEVSSGKQQSPQRSQSSQPKQQEIYFQPPQQQPYSQPQQPQTPYSQPQQPQYRVPVQQQNQYPQTFQQLRPTNSRPQHPSSFIQQEYFAYESMNFPRVMHRPEVFYPPVLPAAPARSNPDVVSRCSLQAAKWLVQNGCI